jgi:glycosyltransferase involved in cell wall biosynthesis/SAM-dependent methyltransferase
MKGHAGAATLGVIMIVKNEEENLGALLPDIRGVADEICIVDTGSTDATVAVAESFGARVDHSPWADDFSAARNRSIACASSDYLLWLDADDRIDEQDRKALMSLKPALRRQKDRAYMLKILGRSEDMPDTVSLQTRIIPNRDGVRFTGRVHEQVVPSLKEIGVRVEPLDITIRHTGYHDEEARRAKARRNLDILKAEVDDGHETANRYFFMAMACMGIQEYGQCLHYLNRARELRTDEDWLHYSFTVSTDCLLRLERIEEAASEVARGTTLFRDSPLLHYFQGLVCMKQGRYDDAAAAFRTAASLPLKIDTYPAPPDLQTTILTQHGRALLQKGSMDEALVHLSKARELADRIDASLWLTLARIHEYRKDHREAQALYLDILSDSPAHLQGLAGVLGASIELDDIDSFFQALEQLLLLLDIPLPEEEISSLSQCADLCVAIGHRLRARQEPALSMRMADAAMRLNPSCAAALLLQADLYRDKGDTVRMAACLEEALKSGADRGEVLKRLDTKASRHGDTPDLELWRIHSYDQYRDHAGMNVSVESDRLSFEKELLSGQGTEFTFEGYCCVCRRQVPFLVDFQYAYEVDGVLTPNWRERLECPGCRLNNRMRATVNVFEQECRPGRDARIYITEQTTPLFTYLSTSYPNILGSEYLGSTTALGACNARGIRNENLTRLSFGDAAFDFILSFDVFEHIPDYHQAFRECLRCLKPGGILYFSVPFAKGSAKNIVRARVLPDGEVRHVLPPEYHGDPLQSDGCLSFYQFGWELLDELKTMGFKNAAALLYWSAELGYLGGEQILFTAAKAP